MDNSYYIQVIDRLLYLIDNGGMDDIAFLNEAHWIIKQLRERFCNVSGV